MQWATARQRGLPDPEDPVQRAQYLCELNGVDLQTESNTAMPPAFLMQQMEWREALERRPAAKDVDALAALDDELRAERSALAERIGGGSTPRDYDRPRRACAS